MTRTSKTCILLALALVALLPLAPLADAAKGGGKAKTFPPTQFYFHKHTGFGCEVYQECYSDQPTDTTRPTADVDSMHLLKPPQYDGVSWVTPYDQLVTLTAADVVVVEAWADGTVGVDGNLEAARLNVFQRPWGMAGGWLAGSAPLRYEPGTGTLTAGGVVAGKFTATLTGIEVGSPSTLAMYFQTSEIGGQVSVRFDSAAAPSCLRINAGPC